MKRVQIFYISMMCLLTINIMAQTIPEAGTINTEKQHVKVQVKVKQKAKSKQIKEKVKLKQVKQKVKLKQVKQKAKPKQVKQKMAKQNALSKLSLRVDSLSDRDQILKKHINQIETQIVWSKSTVYIAFIILIYIALVVTIWTYRMKTPIPEHLQKIQETLVEGIEGNYGIPKQKVRPYNAQDAKAEKKTVETEMTKTETRTIKKNNTKEKPNDIVPHKSLEKMVIPSMRDVQKKLIESYQQSYLIKHPKIPRGRWNMGFSSIIGNVRKRNEDYGIIFEIGDFQVIVMADGCGGSNYGNIASYTAASQAAQSIIKSIGTHIALPGLQSVIAIAFRDAAYALSHKAWTHGLKTPQDGLLTTLIIVIAAPEHITYGYVGDGAIELLRIKEPIQELLKPQRHEGSNKIISWLGPKGQGQPIIEEINRESNDIILVMTDGVSETRQDDFHREFISFIKKTKGDFQTITEEIVAGLAKSKPGGIYSCDDNLTIGIIGGK